VVEYMPNKWNAWVQTPVLQKKKERKEKKVFIICKNRRISTEEITFHIYLIRYIFCQLPKLSKIQCNSRSSWRASWERETSPVLFKFYFITNSTRELNCENFIDVCSVCWTSSPNPLYLLPFFSLPFSVWCVSLCCLHTYTCNKLNLFLSR
jgi:hypothetical protein